MRKFQCMQEIIIWIMVSLFSDLINAFSFNICSLVEAYGDKKRWIFFCEDETIINLPGLVKMFNKYDARKVCCIKC